MDNQIELFKEQEITTQDIQSLIVKLPNRPSAMLASALAEIYGTETRRINEAVDRNKDRFPEDFYFQATDEEKRFLMSQSAMSKKAQAANPYLFTREGANMLSSVLHTDIAVKRSVQIMRAFSQLEVNTMTIGINNTIAEHVEATLRVAKLFGLEGNQALLSTNNAVREITGVDCMKLLDIKGLVKEDKIQYFIPSVLGKQIGTTGEKFNRMLESIGYQKEGRDHKNRLVWIVTEKGKPFCQMVDTHKKHNNGSPVFQAKWSEEVLSKVLPDYKQAA